MSENVTSYGVMAPLVKPVGDYRTENHEAFSEWLYEIGLRVNYEGTLVFTEKTEDDGGAGIFLSSPHLRDEFWKLCRENGVAIHEAYSQFYVSNWYNGADSYQSEIT